MEGPGESRKRECGDPVGCVLFVVCIGCNRPMVKVEWHLMLHPSYYFAKPPCSVFQYELFTYQDMFTCDANIF